MSSNILKLFGGGDLEDITALIGALEKSAFDYLRLEGDGIRLVIGKNGVSEVADTPKDSVREQTAPAQICTAPAADTPEPAAEPAAPPQAEQAPSPAPAPAEEAAGIVIVRSPSYGIFYAQSEPGAPPYVQIGDTVKAGATLGLLEIMKTFNAISSDVDGQVVAIHVQNQEVLEPEQPLFSIKV